MINEIDVTISGLGPIEYASIEMRPFTVIAGPNGSGKSFVTKLAYCFLKAISVEHLQLKMTQVYNMGNLFLGFVKNSFEESDDFKSFVNSIHEIQHILQLIDKYSDYLLKNSYYSVQMAVIKELRINIYESINSLQQLYLMLTEELENKNHITDDLFILDQIRNKEFLSLAIKEILELYEVLENPEKEIEKLTEKYLLNELLENFQIASVKQLITTNNNDASFIDFRGYGRVEFNVNRPNTIKLTLNNLGIDQLKKINPVVFIESPIYWKLRRALSEQGAKNNKKTNFGRESLTGVPKHFLDLNEMVEVQVKKDRSSLINIGDMITSFIKGKLSVTDRGEINYYADKYNDLHNSEGVSLTLTASGVINLGVIQLLLEKGIICKGSCLFIDEPEVNLHPGWQKILIMVLFELSLRGVRIVITTHSIDIMKNIEFLLEREKISESHFGINQLSTEGRSINELNSNIVKVSEIQLDLGKPFHDTFVDISLL